MFVKKSKISSILLVMVIIVLIGAGLLSGCTATTNNGGGIEVENENPPAAEENKQDDIMSQFTKLLAESPKPDAIIEFMEKNIAEVSKENASVMINELEKVQKIYLLELEKKYFDGTAVQEKLFDIYKSDFDLNKIYDAEDEKLKSLLDETKSMGYKVETAEGTFFPVTDYEYLKKFSPYASEDMKGYIDIMAAESNKMPAKDAALVISWDEVVGRALKQEDFIKKHGNSDKADTVKELQEKYITFMFYGLNNTPLFSYDTKAMDPDAKAVYAKAVEENSGSELMQLLGKYMEVLKKSDYKLTEAVDEFRKGAAGSK